MAKKTVKAKAGRLQPRKAPEYVNLSKRSEPEKKPLNKPANKPSPASLADELDYFPGISPGRHVTADVRKKKTVKPLRTEKPEKGRKSSSAEKAQPPAPRSGVSAANTGRVVNLDMGRKLTKKDRVRLQDWEGEKRSQKLDSLFAALVKDTRKKTGHESVMLGGETDKLVVSIPMFGGHGPEAKKFPGCLPMEWLLGQDGWLLGLIIQLVAKTGVGKSGFLAEIFRWFDLAGGGSELEEAESKFNPQWYRSIHPGFDKRTIYNPCGSVEAWQRNLTDGTKAMQMKLLGTPEEPGPGRTIPVCFGVDSIMGKASEETQEKILGKLIKGGMRGLTGTGAATRSFPIEALIITLYMKTYPGLLAGWPFSLVLVNHLKIRQDDAGNSVRSKSGGVAVDFQESFELEIKKVGGHKKMIRCAEFEGYPVMISNEKNSFGVTHRNIQTRVLWRWLEDKVTGVYKQHTIWDWDWSTIHMLWSNMQGEKADPLVKANLADIGFHLQCPKTSEIENSAWSKSLGMKKAEDALPWSDVGALIREDAGLMKKLRSALRINERPRLKGDCREQLNEMALDIP